VSAPGIPEDELQYAYSRSSGPGGQNVNRVETRVTLLFDVEASPSLSDYQKRRLRTRLATRVNRDGVLRVVSQRYRTREANRQAALQRFNELLEAALRQQKPRRKTKVSKAAKQRRVEAKRRRSEVKKGRSGRDWG
jgi:ribosome-associated protein